MSGQLLYILGLVAFILAAFVDAKIGWLALAVYCLLQLVGA